MGRVQLYLFVAVLGMMQAGLEVVRDGGDTFQRNEVRQLATTKFAFCWFNWISCAIGDIRLQFEQETKQQKAAKQDLESPFNHSF